MKKFGSNEYNCISVRYVERKKKILYQNILVAEDSKFQ